jgi:hypothetical protein
MRLSPITPTLFTSKIENMNLVEHSDFRTDIRIDYKKKKLYIAIDSAL